MTTSHQNFILRLAKQSLRLGLTITKSLFDIVKMKKIQNSLSTSESLNTSTWNIRLDDPLLGNQAPITL